MSDPFRPQQQRVVQIRIGFGPVSESFSGVKDERYVEGEAGAFGSEPEEVFEVVQEGVAFIFVTYQVEACTHATPLSVSEKVEGGGERERERAHRR